MVAVRHRIRDDVLVSLKEWVRVTVEEEGKPFGATVLRRKEQLVTINTQRANEGKGKTESDCAQGGRSGAWQFTVNSGDKVKAKLAQSVIRSTVGHSLQGLPW